MPLILQTASNPGDADWADSESTPTVEWQADPGDGAAIAVDKSYAVNIEIGAGVEANSIDFPTFVGQELLLRVTSDAGGSRAISVAGTGFDAAGNTIITFDDIREFAKLQAIQADAVVLQWALVTNDGGVLS